MAQSCEFVCIDCVNCGAEFSAARPRYQKYCSDECRRKVRLEEGRLYREANRERLRQWHSRNYVNNRELLQERKRRAREAKPKKPPTERVCGTCGATFLSQRFRLYCSGSCQRDRFNEGRKARRTAIRHADAPRLCAVCGDTYVGPPQQKVCSLVECQTARARVSTAIWHENNREHFRKWARRYRQAHPERISLNAHNCYIANRAQVNEKHRLYFRANQKRAKARARDYYRRTWAAVLWWREHIGPASRANAANILAALREVGYDDRGS